MHQKYKRAINVRMIDVECMKMSLKAATASQRQDKPGLVTVHEEAYAQVQSYASCCLKDIDLWLKNVKKEKLKGVVYLTTISSQWWNWWRCV